MGEQNQYNMMMLRILLQNLMQLPEGEEPESDCSAGGEIFTVITGSIDKHDLYGVYQILETKPEKFTLFLNSSGGDLYTIISLHHLLKGINIPVTCINTGRVQGAAFLIFLAAQKRFCFPLSSFYFYDFVNDAAIGILNDLAEKECRANLHTKVLETLTMETEIDESMWLRYMEGKYFSADEAHNLGLVERVVTNIV